MLLATGGYGNVYYLSTNAVNSQRHRDLARAQARRALRQPVLHADPPDLHPGVRRPPVEAHADEREPAQRRPRLGAEAAGRQAPGRRRFPEDERDYYLERALSRASATSCRATSPRAPPRRCATRAAASARRASRSTWTSPTPSSGSARDVIRERYGNLFEMYEKITDENPYKTPMRIYPAIHYTMGGLWVDYNLMTTIPGLFVLGEANFSDHGANRLGASALMQGLADGYFVAPVHAAPTTWPARRCRRSRPTTTRSSEAEAAVQAQIDRLLAVKGTQDAARDPPRARHS